MATEGKKTCDMIKFQLNSHLENKSVVLLGIRQNKVMNWMQNEKVSLNFRMKAENLPWDPADLLLDDNFEIDKNTVIRGNMIDVYFQNPIKVFPNSKYILACMCESKWWQAFSGGCKKTYNEKSENQIENEKEPFLFFETKQHEAPEDFKLNNTNLENGQLHTFIYAIEQE
ncbi:hypothetical protein PPERSA_01682 [Pseudocohnilembus persalinus]|uniref:PHR domain-containing protein n=1 Tax=Pseudocohnilembus persalinus TaxID=266149 RepID=A0A0V0R0T8_PSEPJ|nr:hypothetical protein PPERSA_01682 [Pseudocohnilembus persalinus]|eukprot:KRX08137.1 hypothetical protein PPERSA_01682 [Pseudocohnilembus persalinus]